MSRDTRGAISTPKAFGTDLALVDRLGLPLFIPVDGGDVDGRWVGRSRQAFRVGWEDQVFGRLPWRKILTLERSVAFVGW